MKTLYLLRGLPGSGKSTLAKSLGGIHMEADQYFMEDGEYKFDASRLRYAHQYCEAQTRAWMKVKTYQVSTDTIIVSNTFTTEKEMKPYMEMAKEFGYRVVSLITENRHNGKSVHGIPDETMDKMETRFSVKLR